MGDYIYKTTPRLVQPEATVRLDTGAVIHTPVAGYVYAYKPYSSSALNRKPERQYIAPARLAFTKAGVRVPLYGAAIGDKAKGPAIGDRVFKTERSVSMIDYYFNRIGVIINLDGSEQDRRTLAQILDPVNYGVHNIVLSIYIGGILLHDYGYGKTDSQPFPEDVARWKAKLDPTHLALFEQMEGSK